MMPTSPAAEILQGQLEADADHVAFFLGIVRSRSIGMDRWAEHGECLVNSVGLRTFASEVAALAGVEEWSRRSIERLKGETMLPGVEDAMTAKWTDLGHAMDCLAGRPLHPAWTALSFFTLASYSRSQGSPKRLAKLETMTERDRVMAMFRSAILSEDLEGLNDALLALTPHMRRSLAEDAVKAMSWYVVGMLIDDGDIDLEAFPDLREHRTFH